jgi:hypothetical protein
LIHVLREGGEPSLPGERDARQPAHEELRPTPMIPEEIEEAPSLVVDLIRACRLSCGQYRKVRRDTIVTLKGQAAPKRVESVVNPWESNELSAIFTILLAGMAPEKCFESEACTAFTAALSSNITPFVGWKIER